MNFIKTKNGYVNVDKIHGFYIYRRSIDYNKELFQIFAKTGAECVWVIAQFDTEAEAQAYLDKIISELEKD